MSTHTSSGAQRELLSKMSTLEVNKGENCPRSENKHTCKQEVSHRSKARKEDSESDSDSEAECRPRHRRDCKQKECRCVGEHRRGCERQECDCGYEQRYSRRHEQKQHCKPVECPPVPVPCHPNGIIPFASGNPLLNPAAFTSAAPVVLGYGSNVSLTAPVPFVAPGAPAPGTFSLAPGTVAPTPLAATIRPSAEAWVVPYDGLIRDLAVSADIATVPATVLVAVLDANGEPVLDANGLPTFSAAPAPANPLLVTPFQVNFTAIVSHSMPNNGLAHPTSPYVDSTLTAAVSFGGPGVTAVTPSSFYTATNLNSGVYVVRAGDRVTIRAQTAAASDPALAGIAELELGASLYYERVDLALLFCRGLANGQAAFSNIGGLNNLGTVLPGSMLPGSMLPGSMLQSAGLPGAGGNSGTGTIGSQYPFTDPRFPCCNLNAQFPYCGSTEEVVGSSSRRRSHSRERQQHRRRSCSRERQQSSYARGSSGQY